MDDLLRPFSEVVVEIESLPPEVIAQRNAAKLEVIKDAYDADVGAGASDAVPAQVFDDVLVALEEVSTTLKGTYVGDVTLPFLELIKQFEEYKLVHKADYSAALKAGYDKSGLVSSATLPADLFDHIATKVLGDNLERINDSLEQVAASQLLQ